MAETARLEPNLYGGTAYLYAAPNPALTQSLIGNGVRDAVYEYTARVTVNYLTRMWARKRVDDKHPGELENAVRPEVFIGGHKGDRWVGEVNVDVEYAMADEEGRHTPAPGQRGSVYAGSHDLSGALYAELPARI
jgi:hypothetical protein